MTEMIKLAKTLNDLLKHAQYAQNLQKNMNQKEILKMKTLNF